MEWIGGRLHNEHLIGVNSEQFWLNITKQCSENAGLRFLLSHPFIGPAESLRELIVGNEMTNNENDLLNDLVLAEKNWLSSQRSNKLLAKNLEQLGWNLQWEEWEESLSLEIDEHLEKRWLGKDGNYRKLLLNESSSEKITLLEKILKRLRGNRLPQRLLHQRIKGTLN